jgi:hypothetical protein
MNTGYILAESAKDRHDYHKGYSANNDNNKQNKLRGF